MDSSSNKQTIQLNLDSAGGKSSRFSGGAKFKAKAEPPKSFNELPKSRQEDLNNLSRLLTHVVLTTCDTKQSLSDRKEVAKAACMSSGMAVAAKYMCKVEPWAEEIAFGTCIFALLALTVMETIENAFNSKPQQSANTSSTGTGENNATKGNGKPVSDRGENPRSDE